MIHHPSGARGESREERSQLQNKRSAFLRMVKDQRFQLWLRIETGRSVMREGELEIQDHEVKTEIRSGGRWTEVPVGSILT